MVEDKIRTHVTFERAAYEILKMKAKTEKKSINKVMAEILERSTYEQIMLEKFDIIESALNKIVKTHVNKGVDLIMPMLKKGTKASLTSVFMNIQTLHDLGKHDSIDIFNAATKRAVANLDSKSDEKNKA